MKSNRGAERANLRDHQVRAREMNEDCCPRLKLQTAQVPAHQGPEKSGGLGVPLRRSWESRRLPNRRALPHSAAAQCAGSPGCP